MAVPALRIPVSMDMESLKQQTEKAASHTGTALRVIARQFAKMNGEILVVGAQTWRAYGAGWIATAGHIVTAIGATRLAVAAAALTMAGAINEARRQLEEMVNIAEKAGQSGVSPEFFQRFTAEAKKLRVEASVLEDALASAFESTKQRLDSISPALAKLQQFFLAGLATDKSPLDLFRNAADQSERVYALVVAIDELKRSGEELAAFDLAETALGKSFADKMRLGKINVSEFRLELERLKRAGVRNGEIFSDEIVKQAEEIDRKLKLANETLVQNLRPAFDGLADVALSIKNVWAEIVGILAKAAGIMEVFSRPAQIRGLEQERAELERRLAADESVGVLRTPLSQTAQGRMERARLEAINRELARYDTERYASDFQGPYPASATIPLPRARPADAPAARETSTSISFDRFENAAESIKRRTAALDAETANIDKNTMARERARVVAELQTVAVQANTLAGKENTDVTTEQQAVIDRVAEAYGRAAQAAEDARSPLREYVREASNLNRRLQDVAVDGLRSVEDGLIALAQRSKSTTEAFRDMASSIISDLGRILIRRGLAGLVDGLFGGGVNSLLHVPGGYSAAFPKPIGTNAGGTDNWRGGLTWLGEKGPELVNLPKGSQVFPADVSRNMAGGSQFTYAPSIDARGADVAAVARIEQAMAKDRAEFTARVQSIVRNRPNARW